MVGCATMMNDQVPSARRMPASLGRPATSAITHEPLRAAGTSDPRAPGKPGGSGQSGEWASQSKRRILIVEDDEPARRLLALTLRRNYEVLTAADGVEGLALASGTITPDLIITDVMMPRLDGVGMVRKIREIEVLRRVPIIFLTAKGGAADVAAGIGVGARHYLVKPVKLASLEDMVKSLLRRA